MLGDAKLAPFRQFRTVLWQVPVAAFAGCDFLLLNALRLLFGEVAQAGKLARQLVGGLLEFGGLLVDLLHVLAELLLELTEFFVLLLQVLDHVGALLVNFLELLFLVRQISFEELLHLLFACRMLLLHFLNFGLDGFWNALDDFLDLLDAFLVLFAPPSDCNQPQKLLARQDDPPVGLYFQSGSILLAFSLLPLAPFLEEDLVLLEEPRVLDGPNVPPAHDREDLLFCVALLFVQGRQSRLFPLSEFSHRLRQVLIVVLHVVREFGVGGCRFC
mmetsp:Transcript_15724/g.44062  ORF Transcript_15724/g.44062 Transcript_15724/m.44062 type:complete len:273 (+) Transcript_15724:246-1064(+)